MTTKVFTIDEARLVKTIMFPFFFSYTATLLFHSTILYPPSWAKLRTLSYVLVSWFFRQLIFYVTFGPKTLQRYLMFYIETSFPPPPSLQKKKKRITKIPQRGWRTDWYIKLIKLDSLTVYSGWPKTIRVCTSTEIRLITSYKNYIFYVVNAVR